MKRIAEFGCAHAKLLADAKEYVYTIETQLNEQIAQERVAVRAQAEAYVAQARLENQRLWNMIGELRHEVKMLQVSRRRRSRLVITDGNDDDDEEDANEDNASSNDRRRSATRDGDVDGNTGNTHREDECGDREDEDDDDGDDEEQEEEVTSDSQSPDIEIVEMVAKRKEPPDSSRRDGNSRRKRRDVRTRDYKCLAAHTDRSAAPSTSVTHRNAK